MRDFKADIIDRLVAEAFDTPYDMKTHVVLMDVDTGERYYFTYDFGMSTMRAVQQAKVDLSHQWSPQ